MVTRWVSQNEQLAPVMSKLRGLVRKRKTYQLIVHNRHWGKLYQWNNDQALYKHHLTQANTQHQAFSKWQLHHRSFWNDLDRRRIKTSSQWNLKYMPVRNEIHFYKIRWAMMGNSSEAHLQILILIHHR